MNSPDYLDIALTQILEKQRIIQKITVDIMYMYYVRIDFFKPL